MTLHDKSPRETNRHTRGAECGSCSHAYVRADLVVSPDGALFAAVGDGARLFRVADGRPASPPLGAGEMHVRAMAFSPDGQTQLTAGLTPGRNPEGLARLWRVTD